MRHVKLLIVGGGIAGLNAADAALSNGCHDFLLIEHENELGGILRQCAHDGFGQNLDGPAYARQLLSRLKNNGLREQNVLTGTTVLNISADRTASIASAADGLQAVSFERIILACGALERSIHALPIAGTRPDGIYTAGQMQAMMNLDGFRPEGPVVILGSGDIGLIMAEQISAMDIPVTIVEQAATLSGMLRNRQRIAGRSVRLRTGTTICHISGTPALTGVCLKDGTFIPCRTLLTAIGLYPDRTLVQDFDRLPDWIQLCGNCRQVHSMVESAGQDGRTATIHALENEVSL